jgi:iron(III) transport system substrate-binding protein
MGVQINVGRRTRPWLLALAGVLTASTLAACSSSGGGGAASTTAAGGGSSPSAGTSSVSSGGGSSSAAWDTVVAAAKKEGSVVVYSALAPDLESKVEAAFEKAYPGIKVNGTHLTTPQVEQRLDAEVKGGSPGADAVIDSDTAYHKKHSTDGQFAKLVGPNATAPAVASVLGGDGTYVMNSFAPYGFAWNKENIKGTPSLKDLLQSSNSGKFGMPDYTLSNSFVLALDLTAQEYQTEYNDPNFLQELAALKPNFYASTLPEAQAIGSGEVNAGVIVPPSAVPANLPVGLAYLQKPTAAALLSAATAKGPHPNAGQVFADWTMSVPGQTVLAEAGGSALPNIPGAKYNASQLIILDASSKDANYYTTTLAKFKGIFKH